jgi:hypothetical protein
VPTWTIKIEIDLNYCVLSDGAFGINMVDSVSASVIVQSAEDVNVLILLLKMNVLRYVYVLRIVAL